MDQNQNGSHDLIVRCKAGLYLSPFKAQNDNEMKLISQCPNCVLLPYIDYLVIQEKKKLIIHNYNEQLTSLEYNNLQHTSLSNSKKFIVIIDRSDAYNVEIMNFPSLTKVHHFSTKFYKKEYKKLVYFSQDDQFIFYILQGQLTCLETNTFSIQYQVDVGNCEYLSLQPSNNPIAVCYSLQDFNIKNSYLKLVDFKGKLKYEKKMEKTSELEALWSPDGQSLLIQKGYHEDDTGQSYYGQSQVFIFDFHLNKLKDLPTYEGPIHHVQWSPKSTDFILLSGYMPSGAVMYDKNGKPKFEFGKDHKNLIIWSDQRFVMICGFGNLDGSIHVWDTQTLKVVSTCKYKSCSVCSWSPCGKFYVCAKVNPNMMVNNQYTVFNYHGEEIVNRKFNELYDVQFRPSDKQYPDIVPSPRQVIKQEQPTKRFEAFADNALAQQMRAMKAGDGSRVLQTNEKFGKVDNSQNNYPPGYNPPPEKKKRIRNKNKQQQQQQQQ